MLIPTWFKKTLKLYLLCVHVENDWWEVVLSSRLWALGTGLRSTAWQEVKGDPGGVSHPNQLMLYWESEPVHCVLGKHAASWTTVPEIYEEQVGNDQHEEHKKQQVWGMWGIWVSLGSYHDNELFPALSQSHGKMNIDYNSSSISTFP